MGGDAVCERRHFRGLETGQEGKSNAFAETRPGEGQPRQWVGKLALTAAHRRQAPRRRPAGPARTGEGTVPTVPPSDGRQWRGLGRVLASRTLGDWTAATCRQRVSADKADTKACRWRRKRRGHCHAAGMCDGAASATPLQKATAQVLDAPGWRSPQRRGFLTVPG